MLLDNSLSAKYVGSPVFNLEGEIIGLLQTKNDQLNQAVPLHYIEPIISQILKGEEIKRPTLGINYLNLAQIHGLSEEDRQGLEVGALIWPDQNDITFSENSPLKGVLEPGDIITSIEDQIISTDKDLVDILLDYKIGQEVNIRYLSGGEEKDINIILP